MMMGKPAAEEGDTSLAAVGGMFAAIQRRFPVCCCSDEFYYFPQVTPASASTVDWSRWDDFSPESVDAFVAELRRWEEDLKALLRSCDDPDDSTDLRLVIRLWRTLREQLVDVGSHRSQPTFHLTILTAGIVEALDSGMPEALWQRLAGVDRFLTNATRILGPVPTLFREMGIEMAGSTLRWLAGLPAPESELTRATRALARFRDVLSSLRVCDAFALGDALMDRIVCEHMGCMTDVGGVLAEIETEIAEMTGRVEDEASRLAPDSPWPDVLEGLTGSDSAGDGVVTLCRDQVCRLERHCVERGYLSGEFADSAPVRVVPVPRSMEAVRAAAAYSSRPGSPPAGGTFFVLAAELCRGPRGAVHPEYRITAAHETFPGHHLLDIHRWALSRPVRRHVERPVFYEGWACFAESLAEAGGLFREPGDGLILAARRLRRAVRGRADVGLQTGRMDLSSAARELVRTGYARERARGVVRRYALRPGYQVCYTIGQRAFDRLFRQHDRDDPARFVRTVLHAGEIGFDDLARALTLGC